jgi:RNA polymerase sigma-70 factor (ECF subfamily)
MNALAISEPLGLPADDAVDAADAVGAVGALEALEVQQERGRFEDKVLPHRSELYACALRYTRNPGDAEDLVQEALMRAFQAWGRFIPGSNARAWVFRILTNSFINTCRRRKRHRRFATETPQDAERALYGSARPRKARDPEAEMLASALSDDVVAALDTLGDDYREVVMLADISGCRYRDIAEQLEVPIGTVMSRLFRARRQLESQLRDFAAEDYGIRRRKND